MTQLIALDTLPDRPIEVGAIITVVVVSAANVVKDVRENIRNMLGGRMPHYEMLIQQAMNMALLELEQRAAAQGYDGVVGVKIGHPVVVDGAVEVIAYGNGFRFAETE
jgi:uncharacterized protein YbjQ (UPF0145 family)